MRLLQRIAQLATITTLLGGTAALVAATSPAAWAAPASAPDGWVESPTYLPRRRPWTCTCIRSATPGAPPC